MITSHNWFSSLCLFFCYALCEKSSFSGSFQKERILMYKNKTMNQVNIVDFTNKKVTRMDDDQMIQIGKRIQERRRDLGIYAIDFSACIGLGKDQISKIETGKSPCKLEHLFVIAQYLEVSADYLLYGSDEKKEMDKLQELLRSLNRSQIQKAKKVLEAVFE